MRVTGTVFDSIGPVSQGDVHVYSESQVKSVRVDVNGQYAMRPAS